MNIAVNTDFASNGLLISLGAEEWASPTSIAVRSDSNTLHLNLPPITYEGVLRFPEAGTGSSHKVGRGFFRPAGFLVEGWGSGGRVRRLRCNFSTERATTTLGLEQPWLPGDVERGVDLERSTVLPIMLRMTDEMCNPGFGHEAMMEALLNQAIVDLARYLRRNLPESAGGQLTASQLRRIEERVRCEDLRPPSVAELAALSAISERHLLRLFQTTTGNSVSAYIRRELIKRAQRLLAAGDTPLKQIAYQLGFSGPSSFSLAFRQATGSTPARYRGEIEVRLED